MVKSVKEILSDDFWIMPATPEYKTEGIPYITSKNIKNGSIDFGNVNYISEEDYESISKNRPIKKGDILISMIGTIGETAEVTEQDGKFYGQNMFLVRLNNETINKRYFLNYFQSGAVKRALEGSQNQSTQKYLKANHIEDLQIPVPSIEEQVGIANRLDLLSLVITQRRKQLNTLDELIKARFVELFGDPVRNSMEWETYQLDECLERIDNGKSFVCSDKPREDNYPAVLKLSAATYGDYRPSENKALLDEKQFVESAEVHAGDLLFTRKNTPELVGMAAYVQETPSKLMMPDLIFRLVPNEKMNPGFSD